VDQYVPHADNLGPWNLGGHGSHVVGQCPGGFTNDEKVPQEPGLQQLVTLERGFVAVR